MAVVTRSIYAHVIFLDEYWELQRVLIHGQGWEKVAQSIDIVHLLLDGGGHEGGEPERMNMTFGIWNGL